MVHNIQISPIIKYFSFEFFQPFKTTLKNLLACKPYKNRWGPQTIVWQPLLYNIYYSWLNRSLKELWSSIRSPPLTRLTKVMDSTNNCLNDMGWEFKKIFTPITFISSGTMSNTLSWITSPYYLAHSRSHYNKW